MQRETFLRIKQIQKLLGQSDKDSESSTPIPHKFESLSAKGNIDEQLCRLEILMHCKDTVKELIHKVEENDPNHVARSIVDGMLGKIELQFQKFLISRKRLSSNKSLGIFVKKNKSWKERAIVMYFLLHDQGQIL